jgi:carbon-monoxide dehydrogenase medium subunit
VQRVYPGLVDAVSLIGGVQIQGRASIGGNVCNASPAADSIPALITHHAVCLVEGCDGKREIPIEAFCSAPGKNHLQAGEFLCAIRVPPPPPGFGASYLRFIPRSEMDIAVVGAGASLVLDTSGSHILQACLALAAVAPTPLLVAEVGRFLEGKQTDEEVLLEAARIAQAAVTPIDDMRGTAGQRKQLALVLSRRALTRALQRASRAL